MDSWVKAGLARLIRKEQDGIHRNHSALGSEPTVWARDDIRSVPARRPSRDARATRAAQGQTFVDVLVELEPQLAQRLTGTADDPFYDDGKLPGFLVRVAEELR